MAAVSPLTLFSAGGSLIQGFGGFQQARFQQQAAQQNAVFAAALGERNAQAELQRAEAEEVRFRRDRQRRSAATRAAFGAAGVQVEGTPLEVLADQAAEAEEDALLIRLGGLTAAQRARLRGDVEAREQRLRAAAFRQQAGTSLLAGGLEAGETIGEELLA